jgi:Domain of unknown function (DUF4157)
MESVYCPYGLGCSNWEALLDNAVCVDIIPSTIEFFEDQHREKFDDVRFRMSPAINRLSQRLNTLAFSRGELVCLSSELLRCSREFVSHVIAHELAHVIQRRRKPTYSITDQQIEEEAEMSACLVSQGKGSMPLSGDCSGKLRCFGPAGHYYTVFYTAASAGIDPALTKQVAFFSQLPDMAIELDAVMCGALIAKAIAEKMPYSHLVRRQRGLHCLTGRLSATETVVRKEVLQSSLGEPWEAGLAAHAFGDSFAHRVFGYEEQMYQERIGHGREIFNVDKLVNGEFNNPHKPDMVDLRPYLYREYAMGLFTIFRKSVVQDGDTEQEKVLRDKIFQSLLEVARATGDEKQIDVLRNLIGACPRYADKVPLPGVGSMYPLPWTVLAGLYGQQLGSVTLPRIDSLCSGWA